MEIFTGQNIFKFAKKFKTEKDCLSYLVDKKWSNGFSCKKRNHSKFTIGKKITHEIVIAFITLKVQQQTLCFIEFVLV
ncbi:hypothetical protein FLAN108750_09065 [Flavobacterium antarcticum]